MSDGDTIRFVPTRRYVYQNTAKSGRDYLRVFFTGDSEVEGEYGPSAGCGLFFSSKAKMLTRKRLEHFRALHSDESIPPIEECKERLENAPMPKSISAKPSDYVGQDGKVNYDVAGVHWK